MFLLHHLPVNLEQKSKMKKSAKKLKYQGLKAYERIYLR